MTEWTFAFYSSCPTIWRAPFRQRADWVAGLPFGFFLSQHPKDSGVLLHLTARLCSMIASWNGLIFRRMGLGGGLTNAIRLGKWGTVKRFLFFFLPEFVVQLNSAISGCQKGLGWL